MTDSQQTHPVGHQPQPPHFQQIDLAILDLAQRYVNEGSPQYREFFLECSDAHGSVLYIPGFLEKFQHAVHVYRAIAILERNDGLTIPSPPPDVPPDVQPSPVEPTLAEIEAKRRAAFESPQYRVLDWENTRIVPIIGLEQIHHQVSSGVHQQFSNKEIANYGSFPQPQGRHKMLCDFWAPRFGLEKHVDTGGGKHRVYWTVPGPPPPIDDIIMQSDLYDRRS